MSPKAKRSKAARGETSLTKSRGSGFEGTFSNVLSFRRLWLIDNFPADGYADPPLTPAEHATEAKLYDL